MTTIEKRALNAADAVQSASGYPQAVEVVGAKRLLFVSGQIPVRADNTLPKEFKEQARLAWANVEAQLRTAGMSLEGDVPGPANPPVGCNFSTRCPVVMDICKEQDPEFNDVGDGHWAACFRVED